MNEEQLAQTRSELEEKDKRIQDLIVKLEDKENEIADLAQKSERASEGGAQLQVVKDELEAEKAEL